MVLCGLEFGCGAAGGPSRVVRTAAAADLRFAMEDLVGAFSRDHPDIAVEPSYGSSGVFFAQLRNGAPFDLYFSADAAYPRRLTEEGLTLPDSEFIYAAGRIVLWTPRDSPLAVAERGDAALNDPRLKRLAIANPRHAPYGRAAEQALRSRGRREAVADKLVFGENVAQALQFAQSGAADAAVVALALALAPSIREEGVYWEFPLESYSRMEQGGAVMRGSKEPAAALAFRDFVLSEPGRAVLKRYGFFMPED